MQDTHLLPLYFYLKIGRKRFVFAGDYYIFFSSFMTVGKEDWAIVFFIFSRKINCTEVVFKTVIQY